MSRRMDEIRSAIMKHLRTANGPVRAASLIRVAECSTETARTVRNQLVADGLIRVRKLEGDEAPDGGSTHGSQLWVELADDAPVLFEPDWVICPGETLQEWLEYNNLKSRKFIYRRGITETQLANILDGVEPITEDLAERLAAFTFIPARFWLNLEHNYRAGLAKGLTHSHG